MDIGDADTTIRPSISHIFDTKNECRQNKFHIACASMEEWKVPRAICPELNFAKIRLI